MHPIRLNSPKFLPYSLEKNEGDSKNQKIRTSALRAFVEMSVAFTLNLTILTFVATPLTITLMTGLMLSTLAIGAVRLAFEFCRCHQMKQPWKRELQAIRSVSRASMVNAAGLAGPNIAIHEAGHAIASLACMKNAKPEIIIHPYVGGSTSYVVSNGMTKFGELLGKANSLLFITAAGMMASTFFAMFEFGVATQLQEKYPLLSELMTDHAIFQLLNEVVYAITTFAASKTDFAHDFMCLWEVGSIHPLIPITFMIVMPLLEIAVLKIIKWRCNATKIENLTNKVALFHRRLNHDPVM